MYEDVERIWHNCHSYNKPESDICTTASEAQQAFHARWQQQGLPQHEVRPDKTKSSRSSKQAAPAAEAAAAGKGGKKQSGAKGKPETAAAAAAAKGKEKVAADDRGHKAQLEEKGASAPTSKQKRRSESVATAKPAASSAQKPDTKQLAPEKLSASARLRKGLPPTPPIRISPRGTAAEAASEAVATSEVDPDADATAAAKGKGKAKASVKGSAVSAGHAQVKLGTDEPVLRRTSGRLK